MNPQWSGTKINLDSSESKTYLLHRVGAGFYSKIRIRMLRAIKRSGMGLYFSLMGRRSGSARQSRISFSADFYYPTTVLFCTKGFEPYWLGQEEAGESTRHVQAAHPTKTQHSGLFCFFSPRCSGSQWEASDKGQAGREWPSLPRDTTRSPSHHQPTGAACFSVSLAYAPAFVRPSAGVGLHTRPCWMHSFSLAVVTKCQTAHRATSELEACG